MFMCEYSEQMKEACTQMHNRRYRKFTSESLAQHVIWTWSCTNMAKLIFFHIEIKKIYQDWTAEKTKTKTKNIQTQSFTKTFTKIDIHIFNRSPANLDLIVMDTRCPRGTVRPAGNISSACFSDNLGSRHCMILKPVKRYHTSKAEQS